MSSRDSLDDYCPDCKGTMEYKFYDPNVDGLQITEPCINDIHDPKAKQAIHQWCLDNTVLAVSPLQPEKGAWMKLEDGNYVYIAIAQKGDIDE